MIKNVHLAIFINEFGKKPYLYRDLKVFSDARELDRFMDYFNNNNEEVRKELGQEIFDYFTENIDQLKHVEEVSEKKFNGRLTAYYYDQNNQLQFLELPKKNKIIVRDYRDIPDLERCVKYLHNLFDETVKKLNEQYKDVIGGPPKGIFVGDICEKFRQCSYEFSDEELYCLIKYYNAQTPERRKACLTCIRTNVRRYFLLKAQNEWNKSETERGRNK